MKNLSNRKTAPLNNKGNQLSPQLSQGQAELALPRHPSESGKKSTGMAIFDNAFGIDFPVGKMPVQGCTGTTPWTLTESTHE
jgi:hypothetical protein